MTSTPPMSVGSGEFRKRLHWPGTPIDQPATGGTIPRAKIQARPDLLPAPAGQAAERSADGVVSAELLPVSAMCVGASDKPGRTAAAGPGPATDDRMVADVGLAVMPQSSAARHPLAIAAVEVKNWPGTDVPGQVQQGGFTSGRRGTRRRRAPFSGIAPENHRKFVLQCSSTATHISRSGGHRHHKKSQASHAADAYGVECFFRLPARSAPKRPQRGPRARSPAPIP
jgi:hypothetical protein